LRPKYLSSDRSNIIDTIIYNIKKCENDFNYDYIVLLQPTSPLREKNEIDQAITKLIKLNFDSLIALTKLDEPHPIKLKKIKHHKVTPYIKNNLNDNPPRQSLDTVFKPSGNIYIFKRNLIMKNKKILGKKTTFINIKKSRFLNIDNKDDLFSAKRLLKRFK
jgi:CMP-N,N'-diacetyllegionaminic acid synthase